LFVPDRPAAHQADRRSVRCSPPLCAHLPRLPPYHVRNLRHSYVTKRESRL
jgi:hypothetical protein